MTDGNHPSSSEHWFASQGFRTLRIWNTDILTKPEGVCLAILAEIERR
jgi:very-short-patch-repair endonuclease